MIWDGLDAVLVQMIEEITYKVPKSDVNRVISNSCNDEEVGNSGL